MKFLPLTALLLTLLIVSGCEPQKDQVAELEAQVMSLHDEVMPKMDQLMELGAQLSEKLTELDSLQGEGVSSTTLLEQREKALTLKKSLADADESMMDWMRRYRGDSAKKLPDEEAIAYLNSEKEKMQIVKEKTLTSIAEAKAFLGNEEK
jgi:hypothetical protein